MRNSGGVQCAAWNFPHQNRAQKVAAQFGTTHRAGDNFIAKCGGEGIDTVDRMIFGSAVVPSKPTICGDTRFPTIAGGHSTGSSSAPRRPESGNSRWK